MQKGWALLEEKKKLLRFTGRSEHGWWMVEEYMAYNLAEDSEDEKIIEKADRAAEHTVSKWCKKRLAEFPEANP